jgi:hypothetical protein
MLFRPKWAFWIAVSSVCWGQDQRDWSEQQIVQRFLTLSPQAQELRARILWPRRKRKRERCIPTRRFHMRARARGNEFFEASQTLPLNGRVRYLREAGAAVAVADANREVALWSLRSDVRLAFYLVAAQNVRLLATSSGEVEQLSPSQARRGRRGVALRPDASGTRAGRTAN